ncbi:P-loop containing nucleoside triphosphate hydrolase protein [Wilcoxina mikolae CBS 423.85]|nr:P-loop containing nucleoside triphosphate hydrolase protein [Wilcoxina mikolae CBS 423.85]
MVGGTRFFDRAEVKVVVDYLRVLQNPANNDALSRIINIPSRKVGETTVKGLLEHAESIRKSFWDSICGAVRGHVAWGVKVAKPAERGMESFVGLMVKAMEKLDEDDPETTLADIVETLLTKLGYGAYLRKEYPDDFDSRWANVEELIAQAREVRYDDDDEALPEIEGLRQQLGPQRTPRAALERLLANAALVNEKQHETQEEKVAEITISTIHAAKGLEWPVVFVPAVYEGSIPHSRAEDVDEERRLLYVAMTRAQALLYLSCPFRSSNIDKVKLSSFVDLPKVARLLSNKASDLSFSKVQTLAQILSARCPTEVDIEATIESSGILSRSDDQIPDTDPLDKEKGDGLYNVDVDYQYERNGGGRFNGIVPQFQSARGISTTEDRIRYKVTTADKIGFRTASTHFSELRKQGDIACEAEKDLKKRRMIHDKMMHSSVTATTNARKASISGAATGTAGISKPAATSKRSKGTAAMRSTKLPASQGTLMGFFTKKLPEIIPQIEPLAVCTGLDRRKTATEVVKSTNASEMTLREQMGFLPAPVIPKRAGGDFILLSSSPPRRVKKSKVNSSPQEASKMNRVHTAQLLQASHDEQQLGDSISYEPPSSPVFNAFCKMMDEDDPPLAVERHEETTDTGCCPLDEGFLPEPKGEMEATSANQCNDRIGIPPPLNLRSHQTRGPKRTLGIRRSLNGWQNRSSRHA